MKSSTNLYSNLIIEKLFSQKDILGNTPIIESTQGATLGYTDFLKQIDEVALYLASTGFKRGDRVLFLAKPSMESIVYIFAVIRAGGVLVLADPLMGRDNFVGRVAFVSPSYVLIDSILNTVIAVPCIEKLAQVLHIALPDVQTLKNLPKIIVKKNRSVVVDFEDVYIKDGEDSVIIFTSGTTGTPKGVVHSYESLFEILKNIEKMLHITENDVFYSSQLHFLLAAILSGAKVVLPSNFVFNPKKMYQDIIRYNVTKTFGIPAEYNQMITFCQTDKVLLPATLQTIILGSAPVLKGFLTKLEKIVSPLTKVICVYGSTELLPIAYVDMRDKLVTTKKGDFLGTVTEGVSLRINNDEICVSGKSLCSRYLGQDDILEYATGDLGALEEAELVLLGRKKDMIIRKNTNVYPSIFESTISTIPGVKNVAMVGIYSDDVDDEKIYLALERDYTHNQESDEQFSERIKNALRQGKYSIDTTAQPDKVICMSLPLSGRTQKIDKMKIKQYILDANLC